MLGISMLGLSSISSLGQSPIPIPPSRDSLISGKDICARVNNSYSLEKQIAIGRSLTQEIEAQVKLVNDPVVTAYVNRIGQSLVRNAGAQVPLTVKVIDSNAVNALSLPNGFLYVNAGLILAADEEAELAGIMAHEVAHIAACHTARHWLSAERPDPPFPPTTVGVDATTALFGIARFSRGLEAEADYLGIQYMYRAGYDPSALVSYFGKIKAMENPPWKPGAVARAFESHPQNPNRAEKSEDEIRSILPSTAGYVVTSSGFDEVKARLVASHVTLERRDASNSKR